MFLVTLMTSYFVVVLILFVLHICGFDTFCLHIFIYVYKVKNTYIEQDTGRPIYLIIGY